MVVEATIKFKVDDSLVERATAKVSTEAERKDRNSARTKIQEEMLFNLCKTLSCDTFCQILAETSILDYKYRVTRPVVSDLLFEL